MNYLSLFTGVGGFDAGFNRVGMECVGRVEIDKHCQNVLRYHNPKVKIYNDVKKVGKHNITQTVDLICGGFPCQDLSVAGKRKGLAGSRSGLFFEFARIVSFVKPKWFVLENVPGLLSSGEGRDFAIILRWLEKCGYLQAWRVFDSQYFGVAQRRRRVFIVGSLGNGSCTEILFESESLSRNPAESRKTGEGTAQTINDRPNEFSTQREMCHGLRATDYKSPPIVAEYALEGDVCHTVSSKWHKGTGGPSGNECSNLVCFQQNTRDEVREIGGKIAGCISAEPGAKQQNYLTIPINTMTIQGRPSDNGRMGSGVGNISDPVNTTSQAHSHGVFHNMAVRRLTPRECERLQGFPDDWTRYGIDKNGKKVEISDTQRYKMMGNAVTASVAEWIGKRIMKFENAI